jgi:hypothetical protein
MPNLVNEVRFGWTRFVNNLTGPNAYKTDVNGTILHIPDLNPSNAAAFWVYHRLTCQGTDRSVSHIPSSVLGSEASWDWEFSMAAKDSSSLQAH